MTRFRSSLSILALTLGLAACATPSGVSAPGITEPGIAASFIPLQRRAVLGLERRAGAAMVIAPGIAVSNAHNANLLDPKTIIGQVEDYDLLFFQTGRTNVPATAEPLIGAAVTAYGEDAKGGLRLAHGVVRTIVPCAGCTAPAYFTFAGNAGPGFSGGPVVDTQGRLVGITFGYKDVGGSKDVGRERLIYAYDMARVRAELGVVEQGRAAGGGARPQ